MRRRTSDLDILLKIVENPIRRKILNKLTKEAHYPLQLSKELKISQQAIAKHLKALEEAGIVESYEEGSTAGPPRTYYTSKKQFCIHIDVGPSLFDVGLRTFDGLIEKGSSKLGELECEYNRIKRSKTSLNRLNELSTLLKNVNESIHDIEEQRLSLYQAKQKLLVEAHDIIRRLDDYQQRSVLYEIIGGRDQTVREVSKEVDLREEIVEKILKGLSDEDLLV
ncbi:MAG: helix-turn-helix domain-containing protein [Halobacteriota archaeon]|nr:helix-turn-helix domain-containing protein [Halobacteriota archaeon]